MGLFQGHEVAIFDGCGDGFDLSMVARIFGYNGA